MRMRVALSYRLQPIRDPDRSKLSYSVKFRKVWLFRSRLPTWKIALDGYFKEFLELLFPTIPAEFNWDKGYASLDKESQQVT